MESKISNALLEMGADPSLKGFSYTIHALMYLHDNGRDLSQVRIHDLFQYVADKLDVSKSSVERAIRYTLTKLNRDLSLTKVLIGEKRKPTKHTLQLIYLRLKED